MRRAVTKIREDIARLEAELRAAEARQAERIGRLALRAGLGDVQVDDEALVAGLRMLADSFRAKAPAGADRAVARTPGNE